MSMIHVANIRETGRFIRPADKYADQLISQSRRNQLNGQPAMVKICGRVYHDICTSVEAYTGITL